MAFFILFGTVAVAMDNFRSGYRHFVPFHIQNPFVMFAHWIKCIKSRYLANEIRKTYNEIEYKKSFSFESTKERTVEQQKVKNKILLHNNM